MLPAQNERNTDHTVCIDGNIVPIVNQATYLGTTITVNGNYHAEISARIAASLTTLKDLTFPGIKHHFQKMEIESIRCRYHHKVAIRIIISIIIKHRQQTPRCLPKQTTQDNYRNQTCLLFQNQKPTSYSNS